jgi:IAA-amino acid hydrolase
MVKMTGTFRSLSGSGLSIVKRRIEEIAVGIATANRCEATITYTIQDFPPTINDEACWALARKAAEVLVDRAQIQRMEPILGGEDFAFYQQRIPGCFSFLGVSAPEWDTRHSVHHPQFEVDEAALPIGAAWHAQIAIDSLNESSHMLLPEVPRSKLSA